MSVQTDEAGDDQLYHEAHIDYNKLEAEIKATNDERDAVFNVQYPDIDYNASLYTTVAEYNESWLQWSKNEDQRITELELESAPVRTANTTLMLLTFRQASMASASAIAPIPSRSAFESLPLELDTRTILRVEFETIWPLWHALHEI